MNNGQWNVEIFDSHIHISKQDFQLLFGEQEKLIPVKQLTQPGLFVAKQMLNVKGMNGHSITLPIYGPFRARTQIEISQAEAKRINTDAIRQVSGSKGSGSVMLKNGQIGIVKEGCVIIPNMHLHIPPEFSSPFNLQHLQTTTLKLDGKNDVVLREVVVRVSHMYVTQVHISREDAQKYGIANGDTCSLA
ncbi:MAG: Propanediol utilization protein [Herbinix sp.]|jgi:putative phosphotransacetylase|nr:Propanediol utilization protein [Herbinix sp.]